jgi:hypothetical protein
MALSNPMHSIREEEREKGTATDLLIYGNSDCHGSRNDNMNLRGMRQAKW